ncbi:MAG: hypothetical protein K5769_10025 [Pseudobutyrivibrio sp.]|nr:hypothetical protein [Pseudobutyrivibrio sp.]
MKHINLFAILLCTIFMLFNASMIAYADVDASTTVYITKTGQKYHRSDCSYLRQSKISITLSATPNEPIAPIVYFFAGAASMLIIRKLLSHFLE